MQRRDLWFLFFFVICTYALRVRLGEKENHSMKLIQRRKIFSVFVTGMVAFFCLPCFFSMDGFFPRKLVDWCTEPGVEVDLEFSVSPHVCGKLKKYLFVCLSIRQELQVFICCLMKLLHCVALASRLLSTAVVEMAQCLDNKYVACSDFSGPQRNSILCYSKLFL